MTRPVIILIERSKPYRVKLTSSMILNMEMHSSDQVLVNAYFTYIDKGGF